MNRSMLAAATITMMLSGLAFASVPFIRALNPSARTYADLPRIDLSGVPPGGFAVFDALLPRGSWDRETKPSFFVYRRHDGVVRVWQVYTRGGKVIMPDHHWWNTYSYPCEDFGPTRVAGRVDETLPIRCHDVMPEGWGDGWKREWVWDIDGNPLGFSDRMWRAQGRMDDKWFVLGPRDPGAG